MEEGLLVNKQRISGLTREQVFEWGPTYILHVRRRHFVVGLLKSYMWYCGLLGAHNTPAPEGLGRLQTISE